MLVYSIEFDKKAKQYVVPFASIFPGQSGCSTNGGKDPFRPCIFPFTFDGVKYFGCPKDLFEEDKRWCSTKVDADGNHVTGQNKYGFCSPNCPIHNDGEYYIIRMS